jgi:hypothetical protein
MKYVGLSAAVFVIVGVVGFNSPQSQAAYHPNCSNNPNSTKFQMGGCGGGASAKHKGHSSSSKAKAPKKIR